MRGVVVGLSRVVLVAMVCLVVFMMSEAIWVGACLYLQFNDNESFTLDNDIFAMYLLH